LRAAVAALRWKRDATWEELTLNGYSNLTMEAAASRARASRAVSPSAAACPS
jgi:hypothetical protein